MTVAGLSPWPGLLLSSESLLALCPTCAPSLLRPTLMHKPGPGPGVNITHESRDNVEVKDRNAEPAGRVPWSSRVVRVGCPGLTTLVCGDTRGPCGCSRGREGRRHRAEGRGRFPAKKHTGLLLHKVPRRPGEPLAVGSDRGGVGAAAQAKEVTAVGWPEVEAQRQIPLPQPGGSPRRPGPATELVEPTLLLASPEGQTAPAPRARDSDTGFHTAAQAPEHRMDLDATEGP